MVFIVCAIRVVSILLMLGMCFPFADYMTNSRYCDVPLKVGSIIMGQEVQLSNDHHLEVHQNGVKLENGTNVATGKDITVKLVPPIYEMVLECSAGSTFKHSGCGGLRTNVNDALLQPGVEDSGDMAVVQIVGAWATGYSNGVRITPSFTLHFTPPPPVVAGTDVHTLDSTGEL